MNGGAGDGGSENGGAGDGRSQTPLELSVSELDLTLRGEVRLHQRRGGGLAREGLEELHVVRRGDVLLRLQPQGLVAVELLPPSSIFIEK